MTSYIRTILFLILLNIIFFQLSQSQDSLYLIATITGDSIGDWFSVVTGVGDVNGDGYDDVVVGAPSGNYAKLFLGGPVFDTIPDLIFYGEQPGSQFGRSVAGGKDINGDAFPDIIISAPYYCFGGCMYGIVNSGKVYVYFGGPNIDNEPDIVINSYGWYYHFGYSLDIAGDLNGDGYNDLIISAPNDDYDAHGRVYIYFGGPHLDSTYDILLEGNDHFDMFGWSVSGAGDVNGDDYDDFLVGAPQDLSGGAGKAYLLYGGTDINISRSVVFSGDSVFRYGSFGRVVAGLGDINGDGFNDIGIMGLKKLKVIFGDSIDENYRTVDFSERPERGKFVYLSRAGDLNGDDFNDIMFSTEKINYSLTGGIVFIFGKTEIDTNNYYQLAGPLPVSNFGSNIDFIGKVSNKGKRSIAVGDNQGDGWYGPGRVYLYSYILVNAVEENYKNIPNQFELYQNYPNPFNNETLIKLQMRQPGFVTLEVYNLLGEKVKTLLNGWIRDGKQTIRFTASGLSSGVYFYRLTTNNGSSQKLMLILR